MKLQNNTIGMRIKPSNLKYSQYSQSQQVKKLAKSLSVTRMNKIH